MKRLGHIAFATADRAKMRTFYTELLGLRIVYDTEFSTMLRLTDSEYDCGLVLMEGGDHAGPLAGYNHLGFNVADRAEMAALVARVRAAGVEVQGPTEDPYIGYYAFFRDPDGNGVELTTPEGVNQY